MLVVILIRWIVHHSAYHILQRRSLSLAWRLDREMRWLILHETGFTRKRVFTSYLNEVDTVYLFLNWLNTRVSDDRKYVCGRRLYACINTRKFKGLDSREITSLPENKKWFTWHVISIIAENKPHAHHKTHLHTMKVYNTRPSQFWWLRFLLFFVHAVVFTCSKVINALKRQNLWTDMFRKSSKVNLSSAFFAKHAWLRSRNDSYSQFARSPLGTPGTMNPLLFHKYEENALQNMSLAAYVSETNNVNAKGGLQNSGLQFFFL